MIMDKIALTLAIVGGLNWGSIGIFGFDIVAFLFGGANSALSRVVYTLVYLPAVPGERPGRGQKLKKTAVHQMMDGGLFQITR